MSETFATPGIAEIAAQDSFLRQVSNISARTLPDGFPQDLDLEQVLFQWARLRMSDEQYAFFCRVFSLGALQESFESGEKQVVFHYNSLEDPDKEYALTLRFMTDEDSGDLLCVSTHKEFVRTDEPASAAPVNDLPFRALTRGYLLFFQLDLNRPRLKTSDLIKDERGIARNLVLPCAYASFIKAVASAYVRSVWEEEFLSFFSVENLKNAVSQNCQTVRKTFSSDEGPFRMDAFLPENGADSQLCYIGLCRADLDSSGSLSVSENNEAAVRSVVADMQMEMQMERNETRKKHRRRSFLLVLLMAALGLAGGAVLDQLFPEVSGFVGSFLSEPAPEETATPAPVEPEEVTASVTPETVVSYVAFTSQADFKADVMENGTARTNDTSDDYSTLSVSAGVTEVLDPAWFEKEYARQGYPLDGTEAAVHLSLSWSTEGSLTSLIPQDAFTARVTDAEGNTITGYQLTSLPMGGTYNTALPAGEAADVYKRYLWSESACYLVLGYYQDAVPHEIRFALRYDDPYVDYEDLKKGDRGPLVQALNDKLVALGYMDAKRAGNNQFNPYLEKAVKTAQEAFGLDPTGVADTAFLKTLFSK